MTNKTILNASKLQKDYSQGNAGAVLQVIKNIDLEISEGEKLAIIGVSGSGKSTLLNLLGGLDDPTQGTVTLCGKRWSELNPTDRAAWRNQHIGFVYQFHHLLNEFSALENVSLPNLISGKTPAEAQQEAIQLLTKVGLSDRLHHRPAELSGGERQRVAIARALACKPSLVLMDEPTGNLDPKTAEAVLDLLIALNKDLGISLVVVTHDPLIAQRMDRTVRLEEGVLESQLD
ncbi:ABC transporter ATP-binding protein [Porticoccaceae bacterium]|nr:ABC transporter ATP-binding protein [Porticoccaceae bacterium]